jgi:hypothetical protein
VDFVYCVGGMSGQILAGQEQTYLLMKKIPRSKVIIKKPKVVFKSIPAHEDASGIAYKDKMLAEIEIKQTDKEIFLTSFHEIIGHLLLPDLTERQVRRLEKVMGKAMWRIVLRLRRKWKKKKLI